MTDNHSLVPAEIQAAPRLAPVVAEALKTAPDPATIAALLEVQQRWEAGEAKKAYARALVALKRDLPSTLEKDATVDFTSSRGRTYYRHTSLAAMMDVVDEHLPRHGFALSWTTDQSDRGAIRVTCRLLHEDGHSEETTLSAPPDASGGKGPAQSIASTTTYLRRYTAMALLGLASGEEREPHGPPPQPDPSAVDPARNRRAATWVVQQGRELDEIEAEIGRRVDEWTAADLAAIKDLITEEE